MQTKQCRSCNQTKPVTEFSRRADSRDGYQSQCKACRNTKYYNAAQKATDPNTGEVVKLCKTCGRLLPVTSFRPTRTGVDGYGAKCHECLSTTRKRYQRARPLNPDGTKHCTKCGATKPVSDFDPDPKHPTGYHSNCKACNRAAARRWKECHAEHIKAYRKEYYARHRDYILDRYSAWQQVNKERRRRYKKADYQGKKAYYREKHERWYAANREAYLRQLSQKNRTPENRLRRRVHEAKRRTRSRSGDLTVSQVKALMAQQTRCAYCQCQFSHEVPPTIDHVVPLSKGGLHTFSNIVLACRSCNSRKGNRLIELTSLFGAQASSEYLEG